MTLFIYFLWIINIKRDEIVVSSRLFVFFQVKISCLFKNVYDL